MWFLSCSLLLAAYKLCHQILLMAFVGQMLPLHFDNWRSCDAVPRVCWPPCGCLYHRWYHMSGCIFIILWGYSWTPADRELYVLLIASGWRYIFRIFLVTNQCYMALDRCLLSDWSLSSLLYSIIATTLEHKANHSQRGWEPPGARCHMCWYNSHTVSRSLRPPPVALQHASLKKLVRMICLIILSHFSTVTR